MKKIFCAFAIVLLLVLVLPTAARAQYDTGRFAFRLYGGLNYLGGGDINAGLEGWSGLYGYAYSLLGWSTADEFKNAGLGMNFGGDFIFQFNPSMGVGLGVGYLQASSTSEFTYEHVLPAVPNIEEIYEVKASAIPIKASFYYFLPTSGPIGINFHAGVGYYLATAYARYRMDLAGGWTQNVYDNLPGGGIGFHGGLGLEFKLSPMIGIFAEAQGRYAAFANFNGDALYTDSGGTSDTNTGDAWTFDITGSGHTFTLIVLDTTQPSGAGISDVHRSKVDFSGFSFVIGLIIRL